MTLESDFWLLAESSGFSFDPLAFSPVPEAIDRALECEPGLGVTVACAWARVGCVAVEAELEVLIRLAVGGTPLLLLLPLPPPPSLDLARESACMLSLRRATCCTLVATGEVGEVGLLLLLSLCELPIVAPARDHCPPALFLFPFLFGHAESPTGFAQQTAALRGKRISGAGIVALCNCSSL